MQGTFEYYDVAEEDSRKIRQISKHLSENSRKCSPAVDTMIATLSRIDEREENKFRLIELYKAAENHALHAIACISGERHLLDESYKALERIRYRSNLLKQKNPIHLPALDYTVSVDKYCLQVMK